jgi:predicted kinase
MKSGFTIIFQYEANDTIFLDTRLKKSYCIIIRGPLGVGKTAVAQALAKQLAAYYISIDQVLTTHNLLQSDGEGISVNCFVRANELVLPEVKAVLDTGQVVIFDGNFYHQEPITHLEQQLTVPVYVFTLQAPLSVCVERDSHRQQAYGIAATATVYNMVSCVKYGIYIDTTDQTLAQTVAAVIDCLPANY